MLFVITIWGVNHRKNKNFHNKNTSSFVWMFVYAGSLCTIITLSMCIWNDFPLMALWHFYTIYACIRTHKHTCTHMPLRIHIRNIVICGRVLLLLSTYLQTDMIRHNPLQAHAYAACGNRMHRMARDRITSFDFFFNGALWRQNDQQTLKG